MISKIVRALPLVGFSALEMLVSFVRMFILTHLLGGYEFGFASALSAAYGATEQLTDLAIYRFVLSTKAELYDDALAVAHTVAICRGLVVGVGLAAIAYPSACSLTVCLDWPSFAALSLIILVRGFEHFDVRVGERNYRYGPILTASAISHGVGLVALTVTAAVIRNHLAFVAYMVAQSVVYVLATHAMARTPYRVRIRSALMRPALQFSLPLLFNGIGLAICSQGDRLIVGATVGLDALGVYAVTVLVAIVPISAFIKVVNPIHFAGFHNAGIGSARFVARRKLFARSMPIMAACYALVLCASVQLVVPFVFGARFAISDASAVLVSLVAFTRMARSDPMTTLLIQAQSTRRLAASSQAPFLGLVAMVILASIYPSIEAVLSGVLIGEVATMGVVVFASRRVLGSAIRDYIFTTTSMIIFVLSATLLPYLFNSHASTIEYSITRLTFLIPVLICAIFFLGTPYSLSYGKGILRAAN